MISNTRMIKPSLNRNLDNWPEMEEMDPLFDITTYIVAIGACVGFNHELWLAEKKFRDRVNEVCEKNDLDRHQFLLDFRDRFAHTNDGFALLEEMAAEYVS